MENRAEELNGSEPRELAIPLLVEEHGGRLFALGMRFCGDREEARDLVQETFLQAFRGWDGFQGRSRPTTWLYTIAARVCQRFHRKRAGEPDQLESLDELLPFGEPVMAVAPDEGEPLAGEIRAEAQRAVERAIAELPLSFRMPLVLKEIVGLSIAEIASILDLEPNTVKTRLHRARLRVRKAVEAGLPRREVPPAIFSRQVCLDLLQAKQEALDRGVSFQFPNDLLCERCSELFATLDLTQSACSAIARDELPKSLKQELLAAVTPQA